MTPADVVPTARCPVTLFVRPGPGHPCDDFALTTAAGTVLAVADGVTRDAYPEPGPSGAALAAEALCRTFVSEVEARGRPCDGPAAWTVLDHANRAIGLLNRQAGLERSKIKFLEDDLYGAVGAGGWLCHHGHLHFACVGDAGVRVLDATGAPRFRSEDWFAGLRAHLATMTFTSPEERKHYVRSQLRNNDRLAAVASGPGYGVLTGESGARAYYRTGQVEVGAGETVVLFTDGCRPLLEHPSFSATLIDVGARGPSALEEMCLRLVDQIDDDLALTIVRVQSSPDRVRARAAP